MSSGCGMSNMLLSKPEKVYPFLQEVMKRAGCKTLADFRALPPKELFAEWQKAKREIKGGMMSTTPVKDGYLITDKAEPADIPYIIGSNSHDMAPPILHSLSKKWGKSRGERSYIYLFDIKFKYFRLLPL
jgi:hypothetical protein